MELQELKQLIQQDKLKIFYDRAEWKRLRLQALERDNYECQECKRQGKVGPAQNVHHLKEVKDFPQLALVLDNVESVCIKCHNKEHKRLEKYIRKKRYKFWVEERW